MRFTMTIFNLCNTFRLLDQEIEKLSSELEYWQNQQLLGKKAAPADYIHQDIDGLHLTLYELQDEKNIITRLLKERKQL